MSGDKISSVLSKYVPPGALEVCTTWIMQKNIHLKITKGRSSKYGDYRPLEKGHGHRITINHDLNPFAFLITFIHEVAHLHTYVKFKRHHEPHGIEWKNEFKILLTDFILRGVFPDDIRQALADYVRNPSASSCNDLNLMRTLRRYDDRPGLLHLEDLDENAVFRLHQSHDDKVFKKGALIRKRFQCIEMNTNRVYFISALAEVISQEIGGS